MCQAKIVDALEAEKRKIGKELEELQRKRTLRENNTSRNGESFSGHCRAHTGVRNHNDSSHHVNGVPDGWGFVLISQKH